ncbi:MAG: putative baseplate assembly protein [Pseudanabaenales cyanobacterium]|nr:putative baseplate assembly protein [Pseudanabaenales cyanobacterium]
MRSRSGGGASSPPKIDPRDFPALVQEIRRLVPFYTPEWQVSEDGDSGSALLKIFAHMVAGTLQQLNQVPEKNFIAFLNLLGVKRLPAQSARAPLSFNLSQGATAAVLIPAKTQVSAAGAGDRDRVVFETSRNMLVTPAQLVAAYSVNPSKDGIFPAPPGFLTEKQAPVLTRLVSDAKPDDTSLFLDDTSEIKAGDILKIVSFLTHEYVEVDQVSDRRVTLKDTLTAAYSKGVATVEKAITLELFAGKDKQEHSLYLGHLTLFNMTGNARLSLDIQPEDSLTNLADPSLVSWEYWGEDPATQTLRWRPFDNFVVDSNQLILANNTDYEIQATEINGVKSHRWIRCTLVRQSSEDAPSPINHLKDIQINNIKVSVTASTEDETTPSPLEHCLTLNNLQYQNKTEESKAGIPFQPFQALDDKHQALYLGFDASPLKGPISLFFSLAIQAYGENNRPHLLWEYYKRQNGIRQWARLDVRDKTNSLTQSGTVEFIGPTDFVKASRFDQSLYWLRIVDLNDQFNPQPGSSVPAPKNAGIYLNTTWVSQTETIEQEIVGSSNGKADQTFTLFQSPVLSAAVWVNELTALTAEDRQHLLTLAKQDKLQVEVVRDNQGNTTQFWLKWESRGDLLESAAGDRHYQIDRRLGQIQFGDGAEGAIPPVGVNNIRVTYQVGGGKQGNVDRWRISRLNSSIAFVDRVTNPEPAEGGCDPELLERTLERGPHLLKHRNRADDFERLTEQASRSVARVKCLPNINREGQPELGWVSVIVVPHSSEPQPRPSLRLRQQVKQSLQQQAANLVTTPKHLDVRGPVYVEIAISTRIVVTMLEALPEVERMARQTLNTFLHPLTGGYQKRGWEFGRSPCLSDFYALLGEIPNVDRVDFLAMALADGTESADAGNGGEIHIPAHALVSNGEHRIELIDRRSARSNHDTPLTPTR